MSKWSDEKVEQVWNKATEVSGYDSNKWRKDACKAWIRKDLHGMETTYGWEVDHIYPESKGGSDDLSNLDIIFRRQV